MNRSSNHPSSWIQHLLSMLLMFSGPQLLSASPLAPENELSEPGAIWIAESLGALKISAETAQHLLTIPSQKDVTAVALDTERRRIWLYSGRTLAAYDLDGNLEKQLEVPAMAEKPASLPASLTVIPKDGSLWLAAENLLLSISSEGQVFREVRLDAKIDDLTLDAKNARLWVASGNRTAAYDAVSGLELRPLSARADGLYRHDLEGQELFAASVEGLAAVAGDDRGGLWLASGPELLHLDSSSHQSASLSPFGTDGHIDRLLFDGSHRAVWVSSGRRLAKISASGEILARLDLKEGSQLFGLALQQGLPDQDPPGLELRQDNSEKALRGIEIRYSDAASGVDPASFAIQAAAGFEDAFACEASAGGAHCTVAVELDAGTMIKASVSDHMGNLTRASLRLTKPGEPADGQKAFIEPGGVTDPPFNPESLAGENIASLRGFLPNQPFLSDGEIEAINTANGNVNLSVPLGQVFTIGPLLRYQLRVTHNSDAWSHATVACSSPNCPAIPTTLIALPQRANNAGIGWELHLGQLYPPQKPQGLDPLDSQTWPNSPDLASTESNRWLYVSPDGSSHTLHFLPGRTNTSSGGLPVRYSKDGSHLRMRQIDSDTVVVEHPNGLISQFEQSNSSLGTLGCGGGVTGCWRFEEMRDYYGNKVWMDYFATAGGERWKIQDSTGRVNTIFFKTDATSRRGNDTAANNKLRLANGDELGDLLRVVDKVEIAAVNGAKATYGFTYATKTVERSRPHDPQLLLGTPSTTMKVPELTTITVPNSQPYRFTHYTDFLKSGRIKQVTLPTLGKYQYDYGIWRFPTACVYTSTQEEVEADYFRYGIATRKRVKPGVTATWTYSNSIHPAVAGGDRSGPTCKRAEYRRTQVDSPTVSNRFTRRELFNSVTQGRRFPSASDPIGSWQITDNGLPFDKGQRIGSTNANYLFLSEKVSGCIAGACTVQREKYVRYAAEWRACANLTVFRDPPSCFQIDPVLVRERTIFKDDSSKWIEKKNTYHTGAGHTQNAFTIDNFGASQRTVEHRTDYEAGASTARPESTTTGYINMGTPSTYLPGLSSRWILTPFSSKTLIDNGLTYVTTYDFNNEGVLACSRKRRFSGSDHPTDMVTRFTLGSTAGANAGLAELETIAGGSNGALQAGVCNTNGTEGSNKFTFDHGYSFSIRSSTRIGSFPYRFRATIDRNTGLPLVSFNKADQRTFFTYDTLGRPTRVAPGDNQNEAETLMTYNNPAGAEPSIDIERRLGSTVYGTELLIYDNFGRLRRELQSIPTGLSTADRSERETVYDPIGRVSAVSTVQRASHVNNVESTTRFLGYDPFGRPSTIRRADGSEESRTYQGVRRSNSTVQIRTSQTGSSDETTTTIFDGLGRPVHSWNDEYEDISRYDPNGNVVETERRPRGATTGQKRQFGWDNRGLLLWEAHPEIGTSSANGTLSFAPDALGNTRTLFDGLHTLTHEYDGDGRLLKVREGSRVWQEFTWSNSNDGTNYRKGKLVQAIRHNYPPPGADWAIAEDYEYRGRLGGMSSRRTQVRHPDSPIPADRYAQTFDQSWVYDPLGNVVSTVYPTCITTPQNSRQFCNDPADQQAPSNTVTRTMNHGLPVRVSSTLGISADYKYHWNYQLKRIDYSNGSYTDLGQGTRGMRRPASISHHGPNSTLLFGTGTYQYDEAGNIWAIGAERYVYDAASRLKRGTAGSASRWEAYTYDYKDNLTQVQRDGGSPAAFNIDGKNRLIGNAGSPPDTVYDGAGNVDLVGSLKNPLFEPKHDSLNMISTLATQFPAPAEEYYAYGPGNYRLLTFNALTGERFLTFRDLGGKILREHRVTGWGHYQSASVPGEKWTFTKDHVYGPNGTLATSDAAGVKRFFHTDHLGSPRLITDTSGAEVGRHTYYPFGNEAFASGVDEPAAKFTGHELDRHGATYYMLARSYIPLWLRFAEVDPARSGWNLYSYAANNPIRFFDPTGLAAEVPDSPAKKSPFEFSFEEVTKDESPIQLDIMTGELSTSLGKLSLSSSGDIGVSRGKVKTDTKGGLTIGLGGQVEISVTEETLKGSVSIPLINGPGVSTKGKISLSIPSTTSMGGPFPSGPGVLIPPLKAAGSSIKAGVMAGVNFISNQVRKFAPSCPRGSCAGGS